MVLRRIARLKNYAGAATFSASGLGVGVANSGAILAESSSGLPPEARIPPASPATAADALQVLQPAELSKEAPLAAQVSFDARRRTVNSLLADVQKQSGVVLTVRAGAVPPKALVTAHVEKMPLGSLMAALSRLYSVRWSKTDGGYAMNPSDRSEVEQKVSQMGDWFRFWSWQSLLGASNFPKHLTRKPLALWADGEFGDGPENLPLAQEIWPYISDGDLRKGVPFATLPQELQQKVRAFIEDVVGDELIRNLSNGVLESLQGYRLYVADRSPTVIERISPPPVLPAVPPGDIVIVTRSYGPLKAFFRDPRGNLLGEFPLVSKEDQESAANAAQ